LSPERSGGRGWQLFLSDMIVFCRRIGAYREGFDREELFAHQLRVDGILRNLELLGEAAKRIPREVRDRHRDIPWRRIAGLRDVLAHAYFGLEEETVWQAITSSVPALLKLLEERDFTADKD
jgi:uncharacterized protein with HEPN domain